MVIKSFLDFSLATGESINNVVVDWPEAARQRRRDTVNAIRLCGCFFINTPARMSTLLQFHIRQKCHMKSSHRNGDVSLSRSPINCSEAARSTNKAIVDSTLLQRCALPSPFLAENPFPAIGDAAHRKHGGRPSYGHSQQAEKNGKDRVCGSGDYILSMGKKTPSRRYAMRPIVNVPEEDRATDIGNIHKNFVKDRAYVVLEISSRTDR